MEILWLIFLIGIVIGGFIRDLEDKLKNKKEDK